MFKIHRNPTVLNIYKTFTFEKIFCMFSKTYQFFRKKEILALKNYKNHKLDVFGKTLTKPK